jgi:integrase
VGDVNLESGKLFIAAGKGRKSRTVTLGDTTTRLLRRYAFMRDASAGARSGPTDPFFLNKQGRAFRYEGLRQLLRRLKTRAGVDRAFLHLLRHTSAVRTLEVPGSDLVTLQEKLGHADITTTRRYIHMASATLSERQRAFSPIDHQGLSGLMRLVPPEKTDGRLFHKERHGRRRQTGATPHASRGELPEGELPEGESRAERAEEEC